MAIKTRAPEIIKIQKKCKEKVLKWADAKKEVGFLCAGKKKKITHVFQIRNASKFPLHRFKWDRLQKKKIKAQIRNKGLRLIAEGHSHPHPRHLLYPSGDDLVYFSRKRPHIIALSKKGILRCWMLKNTSKATRKNEIWLQEG